MAPIRPRLVFEVDEKIVNAILFEEKMRQLENIYGVVAFVSIKAMNVSLKKKKILQTIEKPIKLTNLFTKLDRR